MGTNKRQRSSTAGSPQKRPRRDTTRADGLDNQAADAVRSSQPTGRTRSAVTTGSRVPTPRGSTPARANADQGTSITRKTRQSCPGSRAKSAMPGTPAQLCRAEAQAKAPESARKFTRASRSSKGIATPQGDSATRLNRCRSVAAAAPKVLAAVPESRPSRAASRKQHTLGKRRPSKAEQEVNVDEFTDSDSDTTYVVGMDVYFIEDNDEYNRLIEVIDNEDRYDCVCEICEKDQTSAKNEMVECDYCIRYFHRRCLKEVPDDFSNWMCPVCTGEVEATQGEHFLHELFCRRDRVVRVGRIKRLWKRNGTTRVDLHVYEKAQTLHKLYSCGGEGSRPKARRLHLTDEHFECHSDNLLQPVTVIADEDALDESSDDSTFLCTSKYNPVSKCFEDLPSAAVRARRADSDDEESEDYSSGGEEDSSEGEGVKGESTEEDDSADEAAEDGESSGESEPDEEEDDDDGRRRRPKAAPAKRRTAKSAAREGKPDRAGGVRALKTKQGGGTFQQQVENREVLERIHAADAAHQPDGWPGRPAEEPVHAAQRMLTLSAQPDKLPCRDAEKERIRNFVLDVLRDPSDGGAGGDSGSEGEGGEGGDGFSGAPRSLYIAGVPGTGKTASVMEVMRGLLAEAAAGGVPQFRFAEINALRLPSPKHLYPRVAEALTGQRLGLGKAQQTLVEAFSGGGRQRRLVTVLLVDEIDMLMTRDQSVLYNVFGWPHCPGARLAVIGIANTLDLPQRLMPKIASRMGKEKVVFAPYSRDQIIDIVNDRLRSVPGTVFEERAIQLAARKIASVSGDVRRALAVLRHASELWEAAPTESRPPAVNASLVSAAQRAMFSAVHMRVIKNVSDLEQVLLASLVLESRYGEAAGAKLHAIAARAATFLRLRPGAAPGCGLSRGASASASASASLAATPPRPGPLQRLGSSTAATPPLRGGGGGLAPTRTPMSTGMSRPGLRATPTLGHAGALLSQEEVLPAQLLFMAMMRLETSRLVVVGNRRARWEMAVTLNAPVDDVLHVLQESDRLAWIKEALGAAAAEDDQP
eukprot:jgi/Ulvmu1/8358/UM042_0064.1